MSDPMTLANTPIGVFRDVSRPSYDALFAEQMATAKAGGAGDLGSLLAGSDTWEIT
jgi:2-oxoglutarate ferredoxin oxidoreductase subunit beta